MSHMNGKESVMFIVVMLMVGAAMVSRLQGASENNLHKKEIEKYQKALDNCKQ